MQHCFNITSNVKARKPSA